MRIGNVALAAAWIVTSCFTNAQPAPPPASEASAAHQTAAGRGPADQRTQDESVPDQSSPAPAAGSQTSGERFQWKPALEESGLFLVVQHAGRMIQPKTRRELGGPFWSDYFQSVSSIHTWNDSNSIFTNYVGHPLMGGIAGYIEIFNDPSGRRLEFDSSSMEYWKSRLRAMAWSAVYSTQYEIGPVSEASIGNVGIHPPTMAVVDLVITPVGGFGWILLEDYVDKRFISRWERGTTVGKTRFYRIALNPGRSLANLLRFKRPSYRDTRPL
jgi:hypothetical protein